MRIHPTHMCVITFSHHCQDLVKVVYEGLPMKKISKSFGNKNDHITSINHGKGRWLRELKN